MNPTASGSSFKTKEPNYFMVLIKFNPFIQKLGTPVGNLSDYPQQSTMELAHDFADKIENDKEDFQLYDDQSPPFCPTQPPSSTIQIQQDDVSNEKTLCTNVLIYW